MTVHLFNRSSQNGEFLCIPEDMIARVGRICPYRWYSAVASPTVSTPRSLYKPTFAWNLHRSKSFCVSWALSSRLLSARRHPPHRLLWFAFFLLSHYIPGSASSTLHVSSCLSFLSDKSLFHPILGICFVCFPD